MAFLMIPSVIYIQLCPLHAQDEVHERDRFCDFLLTALRDILAKCRGLRIVLMSAALNVQLFSSYFNGCPVVHGQPTPPPLPLCMCAHLMHHPLSCSAWEAV